MGKVAANANYDCDLLLARIFPIKGRGKLHLEFEDVTLKGLPPALSKQFSSMNKPSKVAYSFLTCALTNPTYDDMQTFD